MDLNEGTDGSSTEVGEETEFTDTMHKCLQMQRVS